MGQQLAKYHQAFAYVELLYGPQSRASSTPNNPQKAAHNHAFTTPANMKQSPSVPFEGYVQTATVDWSRLEVYWLQVDLTTWQSWRQGKWAPNTDW